MCGLKAEFMIENTDILTETAESIKDKYSKTNECKNSLSKSEKMDEFLDQVSKVQGGLSVIVSSLDEIANKVLSITWLDLDHKDLGIAEELYHLTKAYISASNQLYGYVNKIKNDGVTVFTKSTRQLKSSINNLDELLTDWHESVFSLPNNERILELTSKIESAT